MRPVATVVTRLRLDAQLFAPAPPRLPHQKGRPRLVGPRLPTLEQRAPDPATSMLGSVVIWPTCAGVHTTIRTYRRRFFVMARQPSILRS